MRVTVSATINDIELDNIPFMVKDGVIVPSEDSVTTIVNSYIKKAFDVTSASVIDEGLLIVFIPEGLGDVFNGIYYCLCDLVHESSLVAEVDNAYVYFNSLDVEVNEEPFESEQPGRAG
jgi:hypothetical protein